MLKPHHCHAVSSPLCFRSEPYAALQFKIVFRLGSWTHFSLRPYVPATILRLYWHANDGVTMTADQCACVGESDHNEEVDRNVA